MKRTGGLALLAAQVLTIAPVGAQTTAAPSVTSTPTPAPALSYVALETSEGRIVLALERGRAPITTANFLRYVDGHRLDGTSFYRTVKVAPDFGFVQFGVRGVAGKVLPPIRHEPSTLTGVTHTSGAISVARRAPGTAQGDFTINVGDQPSLDADLGRAGDKLGYAAFGHVVEGMDVVRRLLDAQVLAKGGDFPGEMTARPIRITRAHRTAAPVPAAQSDQPINR